MQPHKDYAGFWANLARETVLWHKPFTKTLDESNAPFYKWFEDGELNVSYNCLDKHLTTQPEKTAIIFEADDGTVTKVSYRDLHGRVCQFANGLKSRGIKKGDRVIVYMPMSIEAVVAMQACARIGAIHSVVFGGFSSKSLHERITDAQAVAVITADGQFRGGKAMALKPAVDEALDHGRLRRRAHRHRLSAHRRRSAMERQNQCLVARPDRRTRQHLRTGMGRRRTSAVHPLHLRLHRQTQRACNIPPAAICWAPWFP